MRPVTPPKQAINENRNNIENQTLPHGFTTVEELQQNPVVKNRIARGSIELVAVKVPRWWQRGQIVPSDAQHTPVNDANAATMFERSRRNSVILIHKLIQKPACHDL